MPKRESASAQGRPATFVIDCAHYITDGADEWDNAGFVSLVCACGYRCSPCPDMETATDGMMQHAYEAGILTERQARSGS
jgi:hypothetical protein